jgi:ribosomal protein L29
MSFKSFETLNELENEIIKQEIIDARQAFKPHLFKHLKRKIAQLLTIQSLRRN